MRLPNTEAQEFRNRMIVELYKSKKSQASIAQMVNCSQVWVFKIIKRYKEEGEPGLHSRGKARGAEPKLATEELEKLKLLLQQGALRHGFATENWSQKRIAELIVKEFNVSYHPANISRVMRKIGFSLQKPKSKNYRKNEKEVQQWIKEDFPAIKKSKR